jgi:ATP-dependent RNA helicase DeaD
MNSVPAGDFASLGLDTRLVDAVTALGFTAPTPIQQAAIPALLDGRDVLGRAATGTGKTAAFGLPLLQRLGERADGPRGLVLVPTRELAVQVAAALTSFAQGLGAKVLAVYGGASILVQSKALHRGVDVVVATPGRAVDLLNRGTLKLSDVRFAVLDEADEMLDLGFAEDLEALLGAVPAGRQMALFSATLPPRLASIASTSMTDPVRVEIAAERPVDGEAPRVRLVGHLVRSEDKPAVLARVLACEAPKAALVFCRTREDVDGLTELLLARGQRAEALHGGLTQAERDKVIGRLRAGTAQLVVCTDVAARGLDVEHVTHVVHFDVPESVEAWVHRTGRTGRAGREGTAIALVEPREKRRIAEIERVTKQRVEALPVPSAADLQARRLDRLRERVLALRGEPGDLEPFAELVRGLGDVDPIEVAALALRALHAREVAPGDELDLGPKAKKVERYDGPWSRLRLTVGKRNGIRPADLFRLLVDRGGVPKSRVGAIKVTDKVAFADVPPELVDGVTSALEGVAWDGRPVRVDLAT